MKPTITLIWLICAAFTSSGSQINERLPPTPNLVLRIDQPRKHSFENYIHQLERNVILVNKTGILTLRLDCWASYPIDLRFHGHLTNQETTVKTFRKEYGTIDKPKSWFIINATMETYEEITGNYTCASIEHPEIISSYYIFVSPTPPGVLLTRGQKITIQPKLSETKIIFPCAVSRPDVHVQLYKDETDLTLSESLLYDPKVGFTMELGLHNQVFGGYSCRTELSPDDRVNITVIQPKNFQVEPQIKNIRLAPAGQLNISCDGNKDLIIVSEPSVLPMISNQVRRVVDAKTPDFIFRGSFISGPLNHPFSGYVHCKWKNSNETFATWAFSVTQGNKRQGELDISKLTTSCSDTKNIILFECSNPVECRINSCVRKDSHCQSNAQMCTREKQCMQNGLIQCPSEIAPVVEMFFTGYPVTTNGNKTFRYVEWKDVSDDELLIIDEVYPNYLHKDKLNSYHYSCQGSNFVFSSGFKWNIYLQDGTRLATTFNHRIDMNFTVRNSWKEKRSTLESFLTIVISEDARNTISMIECEAPVWNSWRWISRNISVVLGRSMRERDVVGTHNTATMKTDITSLFILISCNLLLTRHA